MVKTSGKRRRRKKEKKSTNVVRRVEKDDPDACPGELMGDINPVFPLSDESAHQAPSGLLIEKP